MLLNTNNIATMVIGGTTGTRSHGGYKRQYYIKVLY